jgi:2'-5' RNA ligase
VAQLVPVAEVRSHWWWRPGWRVGRRFYTWHLTFDDQSELHALVNGYQKALADQRGLDLIPTNWLHLTMQGVGFTDEVPTEEVEKIAVAVRARLSAVPTPVVTFHQPVVIAEAIVLAPVPREPLDAARRAVRAGIADVWGSASVPDAEDTFRPHISLAYFNTRRAAEEINAALGKIDASPVTVTIPEASLIVLGRDEHLYRWETHDTASFRRG